LSVSFCIWESHWYGMGVPWHIWESHWYGMGVPWSIWESHWYGVGVPWYIWESHWYGVGVPWHIWESHWAFGSPIYQQENVTINIWIFIYYFFYFLPIENKDFGSPINADKSKFNFFIFISYWSMGLPLLLFVGLPSVILGLPLAIFGTPMGYIRDSHGLYSGLPSIYGNLHNASIWPKIHIGKSYPSPWGPPYKNKLLASSKRRKDEANSWSKVVAWSAPVLCWKHFVK
jgi:hypothetical protein